MGDWIRLWDQKQRAPFEFNLDHTRRGGKTKVDERMPKSYIYSLRLYRAG